jgi:hypothetical protein
MKRKGKISSKQVARMRTTVVFVYAAWTLAVVGVVGIGMFLYFNIGNFENAFGASTSFSSTKTGNWSTNSTWVGATAPATTGLNGDDVTINTGHTVNSGSLTIDNGVTITIKSGATLYISGNLVVKNNLILNNSGTLIITGNLTAQNGANIAINGGGNVKVSGNASFDNNAVLLVKGVLEVVGSLAFGNNNSFSGNGSVILGAGCGYWAGPGACSNGTLPIKLLSFTAENVKGVVRLEWKTASEENNEFFTIERTSDGTTYVPIATIPGAGTTLKNSSYSYEDANPVTGKIYYRLSQTDYDGKSETFPHVVVEVEDDEEGFRIFPNPLKGSVLNVAISNAKEGSIEVISMKGDKIASRFVDEHESNFQLNLGDNLQPGFYYVNYKSASGVKVAKLVKQ